MKEGNSKSTDFTSQVLSFSYSRDLFVLLLQESDDPLHVLDVGCGVGNATIPLLQASERSRKMFVYACDYSQQAVDILKQDTIQWSDRCKSFVWDITGQVTEAVPAGTLDILLCVYVLSAIPPEKQQQAVENLTRYLLLYCIKRK